MYTLGGIMLSSDDDMRPYALVEDSPESLGEDEVCHGRLYKAGQNGYIRKSFDFVASFLDVLGKPAAQVPANYERGELLIDTATDLETNASKGLARDNSLMLQHGPVPDNAIVKMAQTFRSGTNDIVYLHRNGVRLYFNQSGNRWSEPRGLKHFPEVDKLSSVMTADLFGNGTACLVWSSPLPGHGPRPMRYIDLMADKNLTCCDRSETISARKHRWITHHPRSSIWPINSPEDRGSPNFRSLCSASVK